MIKKTTYTTFLFTLVCLLCSGILYAQDDATDNVHLFQYYFRDAQISSSNYCEAGTTFMDYDTFDFFSIDAKLGFPLNEQIEFGTSFDVRHIDPERGGTESGISDILLTSRYLIKNTGIDKLAVSMGGFVTLPSGKEKVLQDQFNTGAFGALRYKLANSIVLTSNIGLDYIEKSNGDDDREFSFVTGFGTICMVTDELGIVGEFGYKSKVDYSMLTGGIDYKLFNNGSVRSAVGFGLDDDGSPDLLFTISYFYLF